MTQREERGWRKGRRGGGERGGEGWRKGRRGVEKREERGRNHILAILDEQDEIRLK